MEFIPIANPFIAEEEARAVYEVVRSGWISMGKKVEEFEGMISQYTGAKYAIAMNNGTSTLHALLMALDVGPGDEVIVPTLTYISSSNVVLFQGAKVVLCDSDPVTFNVTAEQIKEKITPKTKAFMTVDMKGMPVDYDAFIKLSKETGIPFISDSAESMGAIYKGKKVGTQAWAHSFSFFANKNITTGEGGLVTTNDEALYKKLLIIRNQGQEGRYNHTHLGHNYRMTDVTAAFGIEQMKRLEWIMTEKQKLAKRYTQTFQSAKDIKTPYLPEYVGRHSWYMYAITVDQKLRNDLLTYLKEKNIDTRLSFPPVHIQKYYKDKFGYKESEYPKAMQAFNTFVDIPIWVGMSEKQQDYVAQEIMSFVASRSVGISK